MQLTLPVLRVINREMTVFDEEIQEIQEIKQTPDEDIRRRKVQGITPYAYSHKAIPIYEIDEDINTAHLDQGQMQYALQRATGAPDRQRLDRFVLADTGTRFIAPPGDPSPFVWRDPGAIDCGGLSGMAAVYCAVMSRR